MQDLMTVEMLRQSAALQWSQHSWTMSVGASFPRVVKMKKKMKAGFILKLQAKGTGDVTALMKPCHRTKRAIKINETRMSGKACKRHFNVPVRVLRTHVGTATSKKTPSQIVMKVRAHFA